MKQQVVLKPGKSIVTNVHVYSDGDMSCDYILTNNSANAIMVEIEAKWAVAGKEAQITPNHQRVIASTIQGVAWEVK